MEQELFFQNSKTPLSAKQRPFKITGLSMLCWTLGPMCVVLPGSVLAFRQAPTNSTLWTMTLGMGMLGLFLTLAGLGLWRMERWGVVAFGLFVIAGNVVRLPVALSSGPAGAIIYTAWSAFWSLIVIDLWRTIKVVTV